MSCSPTIARSSASKPRSSAITASGSAPARASSACGHDETSSWLFSPCSASTWPRRSREPSLQPATTTFRPRSLKRANVAHGGVEDAGVLVEPLRSEVAADMAAAVECVGRVRRRLERRQPRQRPGGEPRGEFVRGQIEPVGRQRPIVGIGGILLKRRSSRGVIVGDLGEARLRRVLGARVEHERRVADIVEQRVHALVEQRQPMLEADRAPTLADRFVERVAAARRAELGAIGLAETADRLARQPRLADRREIERAQWTDAELGLGIEGADRFQRVAEEIEPDRRRRAGRIEVEDAAAGGEFADVVDRADAHVAAVGEPSRQLFQSHIVAGRGRKRGVGDKR